MTTPRRLDKVCEITMGQAPDGKSYNTDGEGLPLIAGAGDFGDRHPTCTKFTTSPSKICAAGDIIVGIRATIGEKVIADGPYCLGRGVAGLRAKKIDVRYLWHWLTYASPALTRKANGATFKQVTRSDIGELTIDTPPPAEQQRIADILDKADALRAKRHAALLQLDVLARSIFIEMFGDPATNSKGWTFSPLAELADQITDGEHLTPRRQSHGVRLLSARNVQDGYLDLDNVDYIGEAEYERISRRCAPTIGDVLISCSGTIGRVASVETEERFSLVRSAALVRPNRHKVDYKFLEYYLRTPTMKARMLRRANSSGQPNLFQGHIRELSVYVPPIHLQKIFSKRVQWLSKIRNRESLSLTELNALFWSLQHRAFRGQLTSGAASEAA